MFVNRANLKGGMCSDNIKYVKHVFPLNLSRSASATSQKNVNEVMVKKQLNLNNFVEGDNRVFILKAIVQHIRNERLSGHCVSVVKESELYVKYNDDKKSVATEDYFTSGNNILLFMSMKLQSRHWHICLILQTSQLLKPSNK